MEDIGDFYEFNSKKLEEVTALEWQLALIKCEKHLDYRLKMKTLYGAHTAKNLGIDPKEYYMAFAEDSLLFGKWQWKDEFDLSEQLIRIINSRITTIVKSYRDHIKKNNDKIEQGFVPDTIEVDYRDIEMDFYNLASEDAFDYTKAEEYEQKICEIEKIIEDHKDENLEFLWECIKEGKKRNEISDLMAITPKQLDKIREKLISITKLII